MRLTTLALTACGALALTACGVESSQVDTGPSAAASQPPSAVVEQPSPEPADNYLTHVKLESCTARDTYGIGVKTLGADVVVTNRGDEPASYYVTIAFEHGTERLSEGYVMVDTLGSGQSSSQRAEYLEPDPAPAGSTCTVVSVDRTTF